MNQFLDYDSNPLVDYTGYNYVHNYLNPDPVMPSDSVCEPFSSDTQQFYPYFDEDECTNLQDSWVSPVTYDPASGLYIQTFPPEHREFLEKYGQRIEPQHSGWVYADDNPSPERVRLQSPGFHYHPGRSSDSSDVAMSSPHIDYEATSMRQYISTPPAQLGEHGVPRSAMSSGDYSAYPDAPPDAHPVNTVSSLQANPPAAPPTFQPALDELLQPQPHMIVPSQRALGEFLEGRRESVTESTQTNPSFTAAPWMAQFPHPDTFAASPDDLVRCAETPAPSLLYPVLVTDETPSPPTSRESDGSSPGGTQQQHHFHSQSLSPKAKKRAISRRWSPRLKSMSPKRPALRSSPALASKKLALDKKQTLACLFCRGRKIACGPPLLGSPDRTCNQCARRCIKCEYPTESRRGMRRRKKTVPKVVSQRAL